MDAEDIDKEAAKKFTKWEPSGLNILPLIKKEIKTTYNIK